MATDKNTVVVALGQIRPGSGVWAASRLNSFGAPEMSHVTTACAPPDIPTPQFGVVTYFLRNALNGPSLPENAWPPASLFLRRWESAISEYRAGRDELLRYVTGLPRTNNQISVFLRAVGHFEHSVIDAYLAMMAFTALERKVGDAGWKPFVAGDSSPADRLNRLYNVIKHFDGRFEMGQALGFPSAYPAPLWITDHGLKGHTTLLDGKELKGDWRTRKRLGDARHVEVEVTFDEFAALLNELTENARMLTEEPTAPTSPAS